jgi:hypothetical protein
MGESDGSVSKRAGIRCRFPPAFHCMVACSRGGAGAETRKARVDKGLQMRENRAHLWFISIVRDLELRGDARPTR